MKIPCIPAAIALLGVFNAQARVGETEAEIVARYGSFVPPIMSSSGVPMKMYPTKAGLLVGVMYLDGRSAAELYQNADHAELTDTAIELLLEANRAGQTWKKVDVGQIGYLNWIRDDGTLASYKKFTERPALMVMSTHFRDTARKNRDAEEAAKLKGF